MHLEIGQNSIKSYKVSFVDGSLRATQRGIVF